MSSVTINLKRIWNQFTTPKSRYVTPSRGNELTNAIREKKHDLVDYLIKKNIKIDTERHNGSPLSAAIAMADVDLVKSLIKKGVELNYQEHRIEDNPYYISPLDRANFHFLRFPKRENDEIRFEIIQTLINAGANVNDLASERVSILGSVMMQLDRKVFNHSNPLTPELKEKGNYDSSKEYQLIELLINEGVDLNKNCDQANLTPLTTVSKAGEISILKLLLDKGADINKVDGSGDSALHYAVKQDNVEIYNFLVSRGADKLIKDSKNNTPLAYTHRKIEASTKLEDNRLNMS